MCDQQDAALTETARNLEASWLVALAECHDLKGLFQFTLPIPCRSIGTEADPWKLLLGCKAGLTHINQEFQNFCLLAHTHKSNPAGKKRSSWRQCSVGNSTYLELGLSVHAPIIARSKQDSWSQLSFVIPCHCVRVEGQAHFGNKASRHQSLQVLQPAKEASGAGTKGSHLGSHK